MADAVWMFANETITKNTKLRSSATKVRKGSTKINEASELSINLRGVYIHKSYDEGFLGWKGGKTNDLLISTAFQTGTEPIVQRVHNFFPKRKVGWNGPFFKTVVCSFTDFTKNRLTLHVQVYDVDDYQKIVENVSGLTKLLSNASSIFPVLTPYVSAGTTAATALTDLIDKADEHESIIDSKMQLNVIESNKGADVLQTGHIVCFNQSPKKGLKITPSAKIINSDGSPYTDCSYAVFSIRNHAYEEPKWETTQKVAKLLSQLEGKGGAQKASINFLNETLEGYSSYKKLKRIQGLNKKEKTKKGLTNEEKKLLKKLKSDQAVKPFLPKS